MSGATYVSKSISSAPSRGRSQTRSIVPTPRAPATLQTLLPCPSTSPRHHARCNAASSNGNKQRATSTRRNWDLGRFVQTVAFFNGPVEVLRSAVTSAVQTLQHPAAVKEGLPKPYETWRGDPADTRPAVLVTGATGGVGRRVVGRFLASGKRVRVLVRDLPKAHELLDSLPASDTATLEVVAADLSQPATVRAELFDGIRRVVSCAAVKVQPKEGDADRSKYNQGIKFYDPEIASDTPQAVEEGGMRALLAAVAPKLGLKSGLPLMSTQGMWGALDDVVMGGASCSGLFVRPNGGPAGQHVAVFSGVVSEANNGGFASVRSRNFSPALDLGAYEGLRATLKGDGKRYKIILRTTGAWDATCYCVSLDTPAGEWATLDIPFSDFMPVFRARRQPEAPPLDPSRISSMQVMFSKFEYDGELNPSFTPGSFELPIESITAYLPHGCAPRIVHVSSAAVTRPNRPNLDLEAESPIVKLNDALGGLLTYKLAAEDLIRDSGVPYAIVRPCALTEEPAGMPVELQQGDTAQGKIGRDDLAELLEHLLRSRTASNTTFEVKSTLPFSETWEGTPESGEGPAGRGWEEVLQDANLKEGVTGKTVGGVYTGTEVEATVVKRLAEASVPVVV